MSDAVIARLRRKIALISIAAVFVSLSVLVFAINYAHYLQTDAGLRNAMTEIGGFLDEEWAQKQEDGFGTEPRSENAGWADGSLEDGSNTDQSLPNRQMHGGRKSARTQYAGRFFCVIVGADDDMFVKDKGNGELTDDDAMDLARRVLASNNAEGYIDDYKYAVETVDDHTRVLFLDCTTDIQSFRQLLSVSLIVGGCAFLVASLLAVRLSALSLRPLEESARKQKRFITDAGHELKTPLSVIATNMDILEVDLAEQPEEQEWIESTNRQVTNMQKLVNDLISLSKMEEGEAELVITEVSLTDVAYECVLTFEQMALAKEKKLVASIDEGVCAMGDELAIRQLFSILIDNAIKYASGDGIILVEVRREGRRALFLTRNDWEHDVEERELSSLFDRFTRGNQSRDRSGSRSGYGLGLSIARAIAERNSAELKANEDADGKIVFSAAFPAFVKRN